MKPVALINKKYEKKVNRLATIKNTMHHLDRFMVEDIQYRMNINNPISYYDTVWINSIYKKAFEL